MVAEGFRVATAGVIAEEDAPDPYAATNPSLSQRALLHELNHRVKNNMQMLHALLDMARRDSCSEEARAVLADAGRRVGAMAAAQKVLYEANNATTFDARNLLEVVCENARRSLASGIAVTLTAVRERLPNDAAL